MYMTDMLLQMTMQSTWQAPELSQSAGQTAADSQSQGTSFQDLLAQRKEDLTQTGDKTANGKDTKDEQTVETTEKPDTEPQNGALEAVAAAAAPMVLSDLTAVPANFVERTGSAETPVISAVTVEAPEVTNMQTVQTAQPPAEGKGEGLPQVQQEPQTVRQPQTATAAVQSVAVQGKEAAVQTDASQSGAQEDLAQDLTRSAPKREETKTPDTVVVNQWQTPLFRDVEATPVRVGDTEVDMTAPAQEVQNALGDALKGAVDQGEQRLEIQLSPANLGTVVAEFTRSPEGALHVVLRAETEQTAKLLSDHAPALSLMLQDSSRGEVRIEVPQPQQNESPWQQPDQNGGHQQQQQQQQQQHAPRQEAESFLHQLRLGLVQMDGEAV